MIGIRVPFYILSIFISTVLFAQEEVAYFQVSEIELVGNKVTHKTIVLREVEFKLDASYTVSEIEERIANSEANLMRTKLFNFAEIKTLYSGNSLKLTVNLTERWYIWPLPVFELADPNVNIWWQTKDFNRVNIGANIDHNNFRGRAEKLSIKFKWGYNKQIGLSYNKPYINREKSIGFSISTQYQQRFEVNYATVDNERVGFSRVGASIREEFQNKFDLYYRPGNRFTSFFTLWHNQSSVTDSVLFLEPYYYGGNQNLSYFGASLLFVYDSRDLPSYPINGLYASFSITKPGINPIKKYKFGMLSVEAQFNKYHKISKNVFAASGVSAGALTYSDLPYFFQSGFGVKGNIRGYETYFIEAQRYVVWKNHVKFGILQNREFRLPFFKNPSFGRVPFALYLGTYIDVGYTEDDLYSFRNPLDRETLIGYGLGLDFVTYYDSVLRIEYSTNRFGQSGIYLHFKRAI